MMRMKREFAILEKKTGVIADFFHHSFSIKVWCWGFDKKKELNVTKSENTTHFGYVFSGTPTLSIGKKYFSISKGMYFCIPSSFKISGGNGIVISSLNQKGLFQMGGPIESKGRLKYVDGVSDTLIISPLKKGDGCLNHSHFPKNISQTLHTHPSDRIGIIASGEGTCKVEGKTHPLLHGTIFVIPEDCQHSFLTIKSTMNVIAFRRESDFGPEDNNHPMINRTIINGASANKIDTTQGKP